MSSKPIEEEESVCDIVGRFRVIRPNMFHTLQGRIHVVYDPKSQEAFIIKQTVKYLVKLGVSYRGHKINENIYEETRILRYLSSQKDIDRKGICIIYKNYEWEDEHSYYLSLPFYQCDLLQFTNTQWTHCMNNKHIKSILMQCFYQNIAYQPWIIMVQHIFKQLVRSVYYLHSKGIAHLDLSLENVMLTKSREINTQIIDFGVALDILQNNNSWISSKIVGKIDYMAPEVAKKSTKYDARSADIWSLGVILFKMIFNCSPYKRPYIAQYKGDKFGDWTLTLLLNGHIDYILKSQKKRWMVNDDALDLMNKIFKLENKRIKMNELLNHPFIGLIVDDKKSNGIKPH